MFRLNEKNLPDGFTIIESLVAITILIVGVLGPMTAATRGITDGYYAGNQLVATYLAQEGVELVVAKYRNNLDLSNDWLLGLGNCETANGCNFIDAFNPFSSVALCQSSNNFADCQMRYNSATGFYEKYDSISSDQEGLIVTRLIKLTKTTDAGSPPYDKELKIEVTINWQDKLQPRNLTLVDYLYNTI